MRWIYSSLCLNLFCLTLTAAPQLNVDTTTFDCGTVIEGKKDKIAALFEIKNTGDSPLKIENVRPSCGCTVVQFDTLIPPGKTGKIKPEVRIKGYSGKIRKTVTVISNAANNQTLRLYITANIQPVIDVSERYITLSGEKGNIGGTVYFSSLKKDLLLKDVAFKLTENNRTDWQKEIPLHLKFKWNKTDSVRTDGFTVYSLSLFCPEITEQLSGRFLFTTNHPDKNEVVINGRIDKM